MKSTAQVGIFCTVAGIGLVLALGHAWGHFVWRGCEPVRGLRSVSRTRRPLPQQLRGRLPRLVRGGHLCPRGESRPPLTPLSSLSQDRLERFTANCIVRSVQLLMAVFIVTSTARGNDLD